MHIELEQKTPRLIQENPVPQQTAFWSEVKQKQGLTPKAFDITTELPEVYPGYMKTGHLQDDILVLIYPIDQDHCMAYVPYGPKLEPAEESRGQFLEELSEMFRQRLPDECALVRYDLLWESPWAREQRLEEEYSDPAPIPEKNIQEFRLNFSTERWNLRKANSDNLPSHTIFINLRHSEEELLMRMKPKTRYNIRLSSRRGVKVRRCGLDQMPVWYELYRETASRNGIVLHDFSFFDSVLKSRGGHSQSPAMVELLVAEAEQEPLAAMFLVITGKRATYLYGASSVKKRNLMATYALQWKAITLAKEYGCSEYDLFGVAPEPNPSHPMYGLYRFKSGFGGEMFHRMGCWDYPLDVDAYNLFSANEMQQQGYHL